MHMIFNDHIFTISFNPIESLFEVQLNLDVLAKSPDITRDAAF